LPLLGAATAAVAAAAWTAVPAGAQTVRPVVVEYVGNKIKGKFELVNDNLTPLSAILEPKSFDITETGEAVYRPLDSRIRLRLSAMSVRIPPRQSHWIFFEAETDTLPAWFVIPCTFAGSPKHRGLEVLIELPHTVYMLQKESLVREDVRVHTAVYSPAEKWILVEVENRGPRLGRALSIEAVAKGEKRPYPSFPLAPASNRQILIPWDAATPPEKVLIRFLNFTLEIPLTEASQVAG
jgi:hypothetical protein